MKTIGKYEIRGLLGRGGMGAVYKVRIPGLGKIAALKLLAPNEHMADLLGMDVLREQFFTEARRMAGLRHPNVAELWDLDEDQRGRPFYLMEYVCNNLGLLIGETYRVEAPSRRLRPDLAIHYSLQALEGLNRMHGAGLLHRDIKPFNLLVTRDDRVKLIDFGLSRLRGESTHTPRGMKVGSPYYTAPEQEDAPDSADHRADLFSMAVLLYRCLFGCLPPEPFASRSEPCRLMAGAGNAFHQAWDRFFATGLAATPEQRFDSADAMAAALSSLADMWRDELDAACSLPEDFSDEEDTGGLSEVSPRAQAGPLRHAPHKPGPQPVENAFRNEPSPLDDLGRPTRPSEALFSLEDDTVLDRALGLQWRQGGSRHPMDWSEAQDYIDEMNRQRAGGFDDWRLPTIPELSTLLKPDPDPRDHCAPPVFDPQQSQLWSADRRTFASAWTAHARLGYVGALDMSCLCWVRGVRTI